MRYRILLTRRLLGLSVKETARIFKIAQNTICRWEAEAAGKPEEKTVGSLLKPTPPVRRYNDVLRHLTQTMSHFGFGGNDSIARHLARAGWKISARTIGRIRKEKPQAPPATPQPVPAPETCRTVTAKNPNHVWMCDITGITGLLRLASFKLVLILDVFSRMPLAARLFHAEPGGEAIAELTDEAATTYGRPRHSISDQGPQFTSAAFQDLLGKLDVRHRFGAVGQTGSIAIIERLWRTLKEKLALLFNKPLLSEDLAKRLGLTLSYYAYYRPHQALDGATPAEIYFGKRPAHLDAVRPPRGRSGQPGPPCPFQIAYLDPDRRLPLLKKAA